MSKVDELIQQLCPNGVKVASLDELCEVANNKRKPVKSSLRTSGNTPYYGANNIQDYVEGYTHDGDYVLIAEDGSASLSNYSVQFVAGKFWANNHVHVVKGRNGVNNRFLFHFFGTMNFIPYLTGGTRAKLNKSKLLEIKIPVPPLEVQEEIVNILDKFTQLEAELSAELDARRKQYEYYSKQLLTFDSTVSVKKLYQISEIYDSLHQTPKYSGEGYPMIRVTDIKGGYVDIDAALKVDRETFQVFTKKYKPQFNDIVVSRVGSYGNFSLIGNNGEVCLGQNTAIMHPLINAKYLYYALHSSGVTQFIENNVGGGSQKTISLAAIKEIPIHVPSPEEQARIVEILDKFDSLTNSISEGLPAEMKARRKQYEYYRTKLLTFQESLA